MNTDSPWIALSTRQPQASDWDDTHAVEACNNTCPSPFRSMLDDYAILPREQFTHWRRVELPPLPPKEMTQKEKDWYHYNEWCDSPDTAGRGRPGEDAAWHAALAHERSHLDMSAEQFVKELREIFPSFSVYVRSKALNSAVEISWSKLQRLNDMLYRSENG